MLKGLSNVKNSTTFWVWLVSIAIQILLPKLGVVGADGYLAESIAGGPAVYGIKEMARRFAGGK